MASGVAVRMTRGCRHIGCGIGIALALSTASEAETGAPWRDDIVVTAQKREQAARDVGMAIAVIQGAQVRDQGIRSLDNLALLVPGLQINDSAAQGSPIYTLRGVGSTNPYLNDPGAVGISLDQVTLPYPAMSRGLLFDVARVEVAKGPQGTLFGRNSSAGQIDVVSNRPGNMFAAGGTASVSRFASVDSEAYVTGPLTAGVSVRLSARLSRSDGWQYSVTRPQDRLLGGLDQKAVRGQVAVALASGGTLLFSVQHIVDGSENIAGAPFDGRTIGLPTAQPLPTIGQPVFTSGDNRAADWTPEYRPRRNNHLTGGLVRIDYPLGGATLTSVSAYNHFSRDEVNDWDGAAIRDAASRNTSTVDAFSQELRVAGGASDRVQWVAGAAYTRDIVTEDYRYFIQDSIYALSLGIRQLQTDYRQVSSSLAAFGNAEWRVSGAVSLTGGLRYTDDRRRFSGCTRDVDGTVANAANSIVTPFLIIPAGLPDPGPISPGDCSVYNDLPGTEGFGTFSRFADRIRTRRWMGRASVDIRPDSSSLIYASLASGFRSGGFNGGNVNTFSQLTPYRPETLVAAELGYKARFTRAKLLLEASAFHYWYIDKQEQDYAVTFVGNIGAITNIPRSRINGAEAHAIWTPVSGLSVDGQLTWLDTRVLRWSAIDLTSSYPTVRRFDASGISLPNAPRWSWNASFAYRRQATRNLDVFANVQTAYRASTTGGARPASATRSYVVTDAQIGIALPTDRWSLSLWGRNIFDKDYFVSGYAGNGVHVRIYAPPATYGIRLSGKY